MSAPNRMYIRHALQNKTFLDTDRDSLEFHIQADGPAWHLLIRPAASELAEEIAQNRAQINIFAVEPPKDGVMIKWWYYHKDEPAVYYDAQRQELRITVDSRTSYESG